MQQYPSFDLNDLVAFIVIAETGSFLAAGQRLAKDPTVISRRLQSLEARLGVRLAERTTRQLALTEAGRAYLAKIRPIVKSLRSQIRRRQDLPMANRADTSGSRCRVALADCGSRLKLYNSLSRTRL